MIFQLFQKIQFFFLALFSVFLLAQEGLVTGVLNGDDGLPLPGVNVIVENTIIGTATDFDGNYSIACSVGDTLVFSTIGMETRKVVVTPEMFGISSKVINLRLPVTVIKTDAYKNAIQKTQEVEASSVSFSEHTYNKKQYFQFNRIKDIKIEDKKVNITYFKPDIYFEAGYNTHTGVRFVKKSNLPQLQNTFSQGVSSNGTLTFQGAETRNVFSYGPKITNLEFDGSLYDYDTKGKLVPLGNGNGNEASVYDNSVLEPSIKSSNHLFFNISTSDSFIEFDYTNKTEEDYFNIEKSRSNDFVIKYKSKKKYADVVKWNTFIKYSNQINNQPNNNGFQNNILLNAWVTPVTFNNNGGTILEDDSQRSFASNRFNNPEWLLNNNRNSIKDSKFIASIQNKFDVSSRTKFNTNFNYTNNKHKESFGVVKNTVGFEEGYTSNKQIDKNIFNADIRFQYNKNNYNNRFKITSKINYTYEDLAYSLSEFSDFEAFSFNNPITENRRVETLKRNKLGLLNKVSYSFDDAGLNLSLINNSYVSSIQKNEWFLPTLQFRLDVEDLFDTWNLADLILWGSTSFDVNDAALFYKGQSHNSLGINPLESLHYLATNDLFLNESLALEKKEDYELGISSFFRIGDIRCSLDANYFNTTTKNMVYPVLENNAFQLQNIAAIVNRGFETELKATITHTENFYYAQSVLFSTNRTKVLSLASSLERFAIAGFSSTSKNLVVGESAGVIMGSAYARDDHNNLIIDENGFPLVAEETKIIGDPTPKFNLGFSNEIKWKKLALKLVVDVQKGGDVWNGTQNVLNYFGTSEQSAIERNTTDFIFNGVNTQGEINTIPIDFYNSENDISENKFVRYGFEGVAEDAIEDGSYVNLKSVNLSYKVLEYDEKNKRLIKDLSFGLYGHNLFTWSKFEGASPYSGLYDNSNAVGLNFFNTPLISEIGFKINLKI